jgi:peroxiredoxin
MVMTASTMLQLNTQAPHFTLPDVVSGQSVSLDDFQNKKTFVAMFICQHCPFVKHLEEGLTRLAQDYAQHSVGIVAISANDAEHYPYDAPDHLKAMAVRLGWTFPFCYDEQQTVAKAYQAACTPDFYVFDSKRQLVYRGQFDDSRPHNGKAVTGHDLRAAIDAVLHDTPISTEQKPSIGCNIKWKPRQEPSYFPG